MVIKIKEVIMDNIKELKNQILILEMQNADLRDVIEELGGNDRIPGLNKTNVESIRSDEWRIEQFNRNRAIKDQVKTIEEMEIKVDKLFNEVKEKTKEQVKENFPTYIYESPDGKTIFRRISGDYDSPRVEVDKFLKPLPTQLNLFEE